MTLVKIKLNDLLIHNNPLISWPWKHQKPITKKYFCKIIERNIIEEKFLDEEFSTSLKNWRNSDHYRRIAFLVKYGWDDPIQLDVGVPVLNYNPHWFICDGNHRFLSAIYRGDEYIDVNIAGQLNYAEKLFNITLL